MATSLSGENSVEYRALRQNYRALVEVVSRGQIAAALYEKEVIELDLLSLSNTMTDKEKGTKIMKHVLELVKFEPKKQFQSVCQALENERVHGIMEVLEILKRTHESLKREQLVSSEPPVNEAFEKLKDQLEAFNSTLESATDSDVKISTIKCFQHLIKQYIDKTLESGCETNQVRSDIEKLCRAHLVIPPPLWSWSLDEVDKTDEKLTSCHKKTVHLTAKKEDPPPSLFSKDILYHAGLCCEGINPATKPANPLSFFRNKKPHHSLTEVSFSQSRDNITSYLIAKQGDVVYVAFQGTSSVSTWLKSAPSFSEGLQQQCSQIPLCFFTEQLLNNRKIVLTGHSFGGMLACCVGAQLWHSTMADQEFLLQHIICITFAQPFLKIKMIEEQIKITPQFESAIHSIFSTDDIVPLMFSYLNVDESVSSLLSSPKVKTQVGPCDVVSKASTQSPPKPGGLFGVPFLKMFLQNLAVLQDHMTSQTTQKTASAVEWLSNALSHGQSAVILYGNCFVISRGNGKGITWQNPAKQLAAIELSRRLTTGQLNDELFKNHTMEFYIPRVFRSYLEQEEKYSVPNQRQSTKQVTEVDALKPKVTTSEIHEYPNERVIVLQGENLWFSYKVCLGPNECEFTTLPENTTQCMIEFRAYSKKDFALDSSKQVKLALYTHFASPIRQPINIKKEPHKFSVRQMQLAKHTPSQVIKLAFLCALLEQRDKTTISKRFKAIVNFLNQAVKVVPVESVLDAITYEDHDVALHCATALSERKKTFQPSQLMLMGALRASIRAHTGYRGDVIDKFYIPTINSIRKAVITAHNWLATVNQQGHQMHLQPPHATLTGQIVMQTSVQQHIKPQPKKHAHGKRMDSPKVNPPSSKSPRMYSDAVVARKPNPPSQAPQLMTLPFSFPIFLDPSQYPQPVSFPPNIITYLDKCLTQLIGTHRIQECLQFDAEIDVVSKDNISEVYPASTKRSSHLKSPRKVLSDAMRDMSTYTSITEVESGSPETKLPNEEMLSLIDKIFKCDVAVCASLLGAFMEQQIRIPLISTLKTTAETLSSQTTPVAVGVWALFSQNRETLQAKLNSRKHSKLIVEIREYIEGISQQLPGNEGKLYAENEDKMYAGKLQFLLQGIQQIVTASHQYISYSLEYQLCNNLKFDKNYSLDHLIADWDRIFQNDALSLISMSHRSLVARWLKWTILVHDLREALAEYTCIGVTGLVNSGKSLLVKKLFRVEKVKVGTRAVKRTTVPLLYNLEDDIEGLDVIDFPGVDDRDHTVPQLANLLLSLAQIVIFVVDYRRVLSDPVKAWLKALTQNGVPLHICLTHADLLYSECQKDGNLDSIEHELKRIRDHLKLDAHRTQEVTFYSFDHAADVSTEELKRFGIHSAVDVGNWLIQVLKTRFEQSELADRLCSFIQRD